MKYYPLNLGVFFSGEKMKKQVNVFFVISLKANIRVIARRRVYRQRNFPLKKYLLWKMRHEMGETRSLIKQQHMAPILSGLHSIK